MKVLQINTSVNTISNGCIAEDIGIATISTGNKSYIGDINTSRPYQSVVITIGNAADRKPRAPRWS